MKRRILASLLALAISFTSSVPAVAAEVTSVPTEVQLLEQTTDAMQEEVKTEDVKTEEVKTEEVKTEEVQAEEPKQVLTDVLQKEEPVAEEPVAEEPVAEEPIAEEPVAIDSTEWTVADFTYSTIQQILNGCGYTREIVISGPVISGFSQSGLEKVKTNKHLVLPAFNDKGEKLVGVGDAAFKEQGLESVKFPTGMMVDYDDHVTNIVTKRGNYIIGAAAFQKNNLTKLDLPEGVIAVMSSSFKQNKISNVSIPHTMWWIENQSFAENQLANVGFPKTCDFQLQIHSMAFAKNNIKSVRLPDACEVVHKWAFNLNPGMEPCPPTAPDREQKLGGVVYMYTDNANLVNMERIHHIDRTAESQHSWHQKLIVGDKPVESDEWNNKDFTFEGTVITGLSESGIAKRASRTDLVLPDKTPSGEWVTEIGATTAANGLFATKTEQFETVTFPSHLVKIGNRAFAATGLKKIGSFPASLNEIGLAAFQMNHITSVILPDSLTKLGGGAFGSNAELETIVLSKGLTEIPAGAFGCSDAKHYMSNLTELIIPEGITKIGNNAFAGNNVINLVIPSTVKSIGDYAFSTKNYLQTESTITLPEGLESIGRYAFRNKVVKEINLPTTVKKLYANTFTKEYSDSTQKVITKVIVSPAQYTDKVNFPNSEYHEYVLRVDEHDSEWNAFDFTYEQSTRNVTIQSAVDRTKKIQWKPYLVTGFSEHGLKKLEKNKNIVIPAADPYGKTVEGVASSAFKAKGITSVTFPSNVMTKYIGPDNFIKADVTERGNFVIMGNAFEGNMLKKLSLPKGVVYVARNAFKANKDLTKVTFAHTIAKIDSSSFSGCGITQLYLPEDCDFKLQIAPAAFEGNQIQAVQLPIRTEMVGHTAFLHNKGMEPVDPKAPDMPTWKENGSGVVYLYGIKEHESENKISHLGTSGNAKSWAQKLITDTPMPEEMKEWNTNHFTFDGTVITGFSEAGDKKIKMDSELLLPEVNPEGKPVTEIGDKAFNGKGITSVTIPDTLTTIGKMAFHTNNLVNIVLPDSVITVKDAAFGNNYTLENVKLSANLTAIPDGMFSCAGRVSAEKFTSITIPVGVKTIGKNAFSGNHFEKIVIPEGVTSIGDSAFAQAPTMKSLSEIILPEGLETIGRWTFRNSIVKEVNLPSTMVEKNGRNAGLHKDAFRDNTGVKLYTANKDHVTWYAGSKYHTVIYSNLIGTGWHYSDFVIDGTKLMGWSESGDKTRLQNKNLVLPEINPLTGETITEIADQAFKIPDEETETLKEGVYSPNGMETVKIPASVTKIGQKAFEYNNFKEVTLTEGLQSIGFHAFHGNKLQKVDLPETALELGDGAFSANNITELKLPSKLERIPAGIFSMNIRLEQIDIPDSVKEIGDTAFAGAPLKTLTIPSSVTKIGQKAFHLHHITELTIPGNVKEIGVSAFEGTFKAIRLKKLVLEEGIEKIGRKAFKEGYIESVVLPTSLKSLGKDAFAANAGTNNDHVVVLQTSNIEHMNMKMDEKCQKLVFVPNWTVDCFTFDGTTLTGFSEKGLEYVKYSKDVVLPSKNAEGQNVTSIAANAFKDMQLETVYLPEHLETIEEGAFVGNKLTEVTLPNTIKNVAKNTFDENTIVHNMPQEEKPEIPQQNGSSNNPSGSVETGDQAPLGVLMLTMGISFALILGVVYRKKKRNF